ncbi:MAG: hypothetical protein H8E34_09270 [Bacteroidetes bacterium]|nr:hypothetical protein [Bacteroidota bacterium]MBL6942875.1 hypothetical protein [Bacteroidales bacterium]
MKKYLIFTIITAIALFANSCNNVEKKKDANNSNNEGTVTDEIAIINVADFENQAGNYVGKKIQLEGIVDHICKHGGQRLFLVTEESDARVNITPDEEIAAFNSELEGDKIVLVGIVEEQRIDEDYLREWEEEIKAGSDMSDDKGEGLHLGGKVEKGGEGTDIAEEMEKINNLRETLKESGKDHLSFYSILCTSYKIIEDQPENNE